MPRPRGTCAVRVGRTGRGESQGSLRLGIHPPQKWYVVPLQPDHLLLPLPIGWCSPNRSIDRSTDRPHWARRCLAHLLPCNRSDGALYIRSKPYENLGRSPNYPNKPHTTGFLSTSEPVLCHAGLFGLSAMRCDAPTWPKTNKTKRKRKKANRSQILDLIGELIRF